MDLSILDAEEYPHLPRGRGPFSDSKTRLSLRNHDASTKHPSKTPSHSGVNAVESATKKGARKSRVGRSAQQGGRQEKKPRHRGRPRLEVQDETASDVGHQDMWLYVFS